jgi:hypothetical protein
MFNIDWLRGVAPVESEVSALTDLQRVIDFARNRAEFVCRRYPSDAPTGFQITDNTGEFVGVFTI